MTLCKCGCGLTTPKRKQLYFNREHWIKHHVVKQYSRVNIGVYPGKDIALKRAAPIKEVLGRVLEEKGYPMYISRFILTNEVVDNLKDIKIDKKEIRYGITSLIPLFGYKQRNIKTYEKVELV